MLSACTQETNDSAQNGIEFLEPPSPDEGFQLAMDYTVPAYTEAWKCAVYRLETTDLSNVNSIHYTQNYGMHHMTIQTTGFIGGQMEPGMYDCEPLLQQEMDSTLMIFGAQGDEEGFINLPDGVAASVPAAIDIIHEIHYVNTTDEPVDLFSRINAYTIPDSEVVEGIWGGNVRDENINIPANSEHTEWTRCVMNKDVEVIFLASHTHKIGVDFSISLFDGENSGEVFYNNDDWHNPKIVQYETPIQIKAGEGFEYSCTWNNTTDEPIQYGLTADDEMCNLTFVHTPYDPDALCEVIETSDGVLWSPED
jgi:hypothetical protein